MAKAKKEIIVLQAPTESNKVLFLSCCAPCSGDVMMRMLEAGIDLTVFFYNPNIHPEKEYLLRKEENLAFAKKHNVPFVDADYDSKAWFDRIKGLEDEPERGDRCTVCFDMRLERAALYAHENGFDAFTSCLGVSRWKNMEQVNECGERAAKPYPNLTYWTFNWRKQGGSSRQIEIAKRERFYRQEYCGCAYSLRDANKWRAETGREKIKVGVLTYYGDE